MSYVRLAAIVAVAIVVPCGSARAATVSRFGDVVIYADASSSKASRLLVDATATDLTFQDRRRPVHADEGCVRASRRRVTCKAAGVALVALILGAGDDVVHVTPRVAVRIIMRGGPGGDALHGGAQGDDLGGGRGNDTVDGGGGNDLVSGGLGDDLVIGAQGDDTIDGGDGDDDIQSLNGGRDEVDCGRGFDVANAGTSDRFVSACDVVRVTNSARTGCDPGTAEVRLKPFHPKKPPRSLQVKVTGANRPTVVVVVTIYYSPSGVETKKLAVDSNGKWRLVKKVGPKYSWALPRTRCPV